VSADIFTCQDHLDHNWIRRSLIATFGLGNVETNLIHRGTCYPLANLVGEPLSDVPGSG
jgi:hypothetical protein